jgi:hypothetical protein
MFSRFFDQPVQKNFASKKPLRPVRIRLAVNNAVRMALCIECRRSRVRFPTETLRCKPYPNFMDPQHCYLLLVAMSPVLPVEG